MDGKVVKRYVRDRLAKQSVLLKLARAYHDATAAFELASGMSAARWRLLFLIAQQGECTQRELIDLIRVDPGSITRTLKSLERDGLVKRRTDEADNRYTRVGLSAAGRKLVDQVMVKREAFLTRMVQGAAPADVETFLRVLDLVSDNLRKPGA